MRARRSRININTGRRLREIREAVGVSQGDAAKEIGILRTSLINIEQGRQNISIAMLEKFSRYYGKSMSALVEDDK